MKAIPAGVVVLEKDGSIPYSNERARQLLGVDIKGKKISDFSGKGLRILSLEGDPYGVENIPASIAIKMGKEEKAEMLVQRPDGSCIAVSTSAMPITNENGEVSGSVSLIEDITDRKKVEASLADSEERFRLVAEAAKVFVYEVDLTDNIMMVFRGEDVLGYKPDEIPKTLGWWFNQIHPDDRAMARQKAREAIKNGQDTLIEYRIKRKQGDFITVHDTTKMVKDEKGYVVRLVSGLRDVTERKKNEQALLYSKELLEQKAAEVEEFATSMESLAEERLIKLKDAERLAAIGATAGMVGHDIRNPLQAIVSDVFLLKQLLKTMPACATKDEVVESLDGIDKNVVYINKIVADLQDYARTLKPEYVWINLAEAVREALKTINIPENILITNNTVSVELKSDPGFLRRVLTNLVNNAVQAMPEGGNLGIEGYEKSNKVILTVADTGLGIPEDVKPKLFTPMVTTKAKGQGLGLAVVKRLVESLRGTVSFESKEGKGTKFIIELPQIEL